jgi:hypothetical protein
MASVRFVCLQNAGRSQMSRALFTRAADGAHQALSAGTTPAEHVHSEVIEVMRELDIDLSDRTPQLLTHELATKPTSSSPSAAATNARIAPASATSTGNYPTPPDSQSRLSAPSATSLQPM